MMDRLALLGLVTLAALLALPAQTPMADYGVFGTLDMVGRHDAPWWQLFRYPAPDNSWGARPISVGLLKLYLDVFGPEAPPDGTLPDGEVGHHNPVVRSRRARMAASLWLRSGRPARHAGDGLGQPKPL